MAAGFVVKLAAMVGVAACAAPNDSAGAAEVTPVDQAAGLWSLSQPGARPVCDLALANTPVDGRLGVHLETCTHAEARLARTWRPTRAGFELLDQGGRVVMTFRRTGEDAFSAAGAGGWRLERTAMR